MSAASISALTLRPVDGSDDARVAGRVFAVSLIAAVEAGAMPSGSRAPTDAARYFRDEVAPHREVWLAELDGRVVGVLVLDDEWLDHLHVLPGHVGQGIGTTLLDLAKALRPAGFGLWTFVSNTPAQKFYEHHGLAAVERTDGSGNEERSPDIRYAWPPGGSPR